MKLVGRNEIMYNLESSTQANNVLYVAISIGKINRITLFIHQEH